MSIQGLLSSNAFIDDIAMVIIYGNILQNAVEELKRINNSIKKKLYIDFSEGTAFLRISVTNTIAEKFDCNTKKSDKKNHGLGISCINEYVKKSEGEIEFIETIDSFTVIITLPKSITKFRDSYM